ncbi:MAG: putative LPS assembly protein LptD, partial [Nitrospirota bacterium]
MIFPFLLFTICFSLFTQYCLAEEKTIIISESLEYIKKTSTYIAKGNVKVQRDDTVIESDEVRYNEQTSQIIAEGSVKYDDPQVLILASRAELNLETKTGILHDTEILFKKDNYHIISREIEKKGEGYYFSPEASFTTCDGPVPAWCFRGKDLDLLVGDRLKAKDVSFRIKDIPVFYTPYFHAPINTERHTGFLMPAIGYSNLRGLNLNIPFFWAISENRDLTLSMNMYTKRGIGEGLEYRYVEPGNIKGNWWFYHIRDSDLKKDFYEIKALHRHSFTEGFGGFLNVNFIN